MIGYFVSAMVAGLFTGVLAAEWEHEGMAEPRKWTAGFRVGPFSRQKSRTGTLRQYAGSPRLGLLPGAILIAVNGPQVCA